MSLADARKVADAVLYEGYVLFPYRARTTKNQVRWQFGVVAPKAYCETDPHERSFTQTEVLVDGNDDAVLDVKLRFLRVQGRTVEKLLDDGAYEPVDELTVDNRIITEWQEAVEEEVDVEELPLGKLVSEGRELPMSFAASESYESITDNDGHVVGRLRRETWPLSAKVRTTAARSSGPYSITTVRVVVENDTDWGRAGATRDEFVGYCMAAVHTLLQVRGGSFLSLADPPEFARNAVAACSNEGTWPVLIGDPDKRDTILSSPIVLTDFPEVAPESEGDYYDATEIDEMLALFVGTLTDEERAEARGTDPRAAAIMDRVDSMPPEMLEKLHGAIRSLRPIPLPDDHGGEPESSDDNGLDGGFGAFGDDFPTFSTDASGQMTTVRLDAETDAQFKPFEDTVAVGTATVGKGSRVRLRPGTRSDAQDMFLRGLDATVEGVFHDIDGDIHVAVSVDDDPAASEIPSWIGRFRYFRLHEVEVIDA